MPTEVVMPKVDMDMTSGRIVHWHVQEGDPVTKSSPLFDIETDKAAMEVESPATGILHHIHARAGDAVPIGQPVAWIFADGEAVTSPPTDQRPTAPIEQLDPTIPKPRSIEPARSSILSPTGKPRATPRARILAKTLGLDLQSITGSAVNGRIVKSDVERAHNIANPMPTHGSGLAIQQRGSGAKPPIMFIHGLGGDAQGWLRISASLPEGHVHHLLDLPNHGLSPLIGAVDFAHLLSLVRQEFDLLDAAKIHLVGHSLGGALALALADTRAKRLQSLTLISPAGLGPEINATALDDLLSAVDDDQLSHALEQFVGDPGLITQRYVRSIATARRDPAMRHAQTAMAARLFPNGKQAVDLRAAIRRLAVPCRIIWGRRDRIIPWEHSLNVPDHVSLSQFSGVGHLPHVEKSEEIVQLLSAMF